MWVLAAESQVASDLSAFHRVDDMWSMGSRRWALLVPNLVHYAGAVRGFHRELSREAEQAQQDGHTTPPPQPVERGPQGGGVDGPRLLAGPPSPLQGKEVGSSPLELRHSDIGDMFSFG